MEAETQSPTEDADADAQQHLLALGRSAVRPDSPAPESILLASFQGMVHRFQKTGVGMPSIYALQGGHWDTACGHLQHTLGYRYSLEHWMHSFLTGNVNLVQDVAAADYVYLPHCATGIFMHMVAKEVIEMQALHERRQQEEAGAPGAAAAAAAPQWGPAPRRRRGRRAANASAPKYLAYEGNLPIAPIQKTDNMYLMVLVEKNWLRQPEFHACAARPRCRFLIVSVYGRHV